VAARHVGLVGELKHLDGGGGTGVEQVGAGPFGLAVDANIRLYMRYLAGARPDYHSNLTESLEAEGQFQVLVV